MYFLGVAHPRYYEQTSNVISIANVESVIDVHDVSGFLSVPASDHYLSLSWHILPEISCRCDL
jgi:hypothetical protein